MQTGTIKWFNKEKGFGFIKPDDNSKDIFLYYKELKKINLETIEAKTKISFNTKEDNNTRIYAHNLKLL